ncbi:tetratricopeptide repeat protein [Labrenzia sp. CE80]|uniref:tetratricopeptide repeat protein n=1 Tax=Labrenzia sp. CE80 TaxID=1788986 RepID=UPI00129B89C2|nr:tetratricopeptide repeat protein [Labrenzia sp. CE80]
MNNLTSASNKAALKAKPAQSRLKRLALTTAVALFAVQLPLSLNAQADTRSDEAPHFGTPLDLPITLSGSYLAGRLAGLENDFSFAAAFFQETLVADPENEMLLERTFILKLANGDIVEAVNYAAELERLGVQNFLARLARGADAVSRAQYGEAITLLAPTGAGPLAQLSMDISRAWALQGAGQTDDALKVIDELKGPEWFEVFKATHEALISYAAGRNEQALEQIEEAYKQDRGAIRVIDAYARILADNDRKDDALEILAEYDRLLRGHPLLDHTKAEIEAGNPLEPLVATPAAGMSEILYGLGSAIGRDGAEELSTAYLQMALHLDPNAEFAAVALGGLFERMGQPERAIAVLKQVPLDSPLKRDAEIQIGLNYNALEQIDEARDHLGALIAADPSELEAIISLGNVLRTHKMFAEAEEIYTKGLATIPDIGQEHWLLFYFRGICRERLDKWESAEADFRKALELSEDQPLVLNYLGYSLVDQGLKLDEALDMIKKAVELRPTDGYIVDSLGWVFYRLGRYEDAVVQLERAIELRPSDPVINDHLGDAYWKVGRRNEAKFQWNHARDLDPEEGELPKILEKIANGLSDTPATDEAKASETKNGG